jgi:hypothetical protein
MILSMTAEFISILLTWGKRRLNCKSAFFVIYKQGTERCSKPSGAWRSLAALMRPFSTILLGGNALRPAFNFQPLREKITPSLRKLVTRRELSDSTD